jgi:hypothetical protein
MTAVAEPVRGLTRASRAWLDLTGASPRWLRTILYAAVAGRLSITAGGMIVYGLAGAGADAGFSGVVRSVDPGTILGMLLLAPLLESLIVLLLVWLFSGKLGWPIGVTVALTALLFMPQHGLSYASLAIGPFFALMAAIQHHWFMRGQGWAGYWLISAVHAVVNGAAVAAAVLIGV